MVVSDGGNHQIKNLNNGGFIMTSSKIALLNILVSLIFAGLIIGASYLFQNKDYKQTVTYLLIVLWLIPFSWLSYKSRKTE